MASGEGEEEGEGLMRRGRGGKGEGEGGRGREIIVMKNYKNKALAVLNLRHPMPPRKSHVHEGAGERAVGHGDEAHLLLPPRPFPPCTLPRGLEAGAE